MNVYSDVTILSVKDTKKVPSKEYSTKSSEGPFYTTVLVDNLQSNSTWWVPLTSKENLSTFNAFERQTTLTSSISRSAASLVVVVRLSGSTWMGRSY